MVVLGVVLALVIAGGGLLLGHLSEHPLPTGEISEKKPAPKNSAPVFIPPASRAPLESSPQPPPPDPVRIHRQKEAAQQGLAQFMKAQKSLEDLGAAQWGNGAYDKIGQLAQRGDAQYQNENFADAAAFYAQAVQKATRLADSASEAQKMLVQQSLADIDAGDGKSALKKLQIALKIDPQNHRIKKLLQRAAQAEEVQRLFENGQQIEKRGATERALADYRKALELDPDALRVQQAYRRLSTRVAQEKYRRFMAQGLAAFERREYRQARSNLLKAQAVKPGTAEAQDALTQVNAALQQQRVDTLRQQALAAEAAENWTLALQSYQAVLDMDDKIAFAIDGKQKAKVQIGFLKRLDFFLQQPQSLQDDHQLDHARQLIGELQAAPFNGSGITWRASRLKELVTVYATPIPVTIQSDGLTNVAVYRVGRLGSFTVHRLQLRPGIYTVVGSRDGYQDVRQEVTVKPGQPSLEINIACKIRV